MTLNPVDSEFQDTLRTHLPGDVLRPLSARYLEEPRGRWHGQAGVLAAPRQVEEVATLIRLASDARVPVVPYGGGTGLVGG
ncbi:MAG: FAD-binding protein, partial [Roseobacter sp.]|nr:FAD-binding protein [Roseobacter sp.]